MTKNLLAKKIRDIINDTLATSSVDLKSHESPTLSEFLDEYPTDFNADSLADEISEMVMDKFMSARTFEYRETANPIEGGNLVCRGCYRNHGEWFNNFANISDDVLLKTGTKIVLLED